MQNTYLENRLKNYVDEKIEESGSGGSGLPEVTSADDGKVLGVDDGEWTTVELPESGGNELVRLNLAYSEIYKAGEYDALSINDIRGLIGVEDNTNVKQCVLIEQPDWAEDNYRHYYRLTDLASYQYEENSETKYLFTATFIGCNPSREQFTNKPIKPTTPTILYFTADTYSAPLSLVN